MDTIHSAIDHLTQQLSGISTSPRLDAELLVAQTTTRSRTQLWTHAHVPLTALQKNIISNHSRRRSLGEPLAYILGKKEFWSHTLTVTPDVLIPRPETEMLVEWVLTQWPSEKIAHISDLGTGSGAIAIALAKERPHWIIDATDDSPKALAVAAYNAKQLECSNIHFYQGSWCKALPKQNYDLILSNPPYIQENDRHLTQLKYEPRKALIAGPDGLSALTAIIQSAQKYLNPSGHLLLEHGYNQSEPVATLLKAAHYTDIQHYKDLAGLTRMTQAKRS